LSAGEKKKGANEVKAAEVARGNSRIKKTNASRRSRGSRWASFDTRTVFSEEGFRETNGIEKIVSKNLAQNSSKISDRRLSDHIAGSLIGENDNEILMDENMRLGDTLYVDTEKGGAVQITISNPENAQDQNENQISDLVPTPKFSDNHHNDLKNLLQLTVDTQEANQGVRDEKEEVGSPWKLNTSEENQLLNNALSPRAFDRLNVRVKNQDTPGSAKSMTSDKTNPSVPKLILGDDRGTSDIPTP